MTRSEKGGQNVPLFDDITFEKAQQKEDKHEVKYVSFCVENGQTD